MSSSAARVNVCSNNAVASELSRLFSPVFYVKKEDLDPFVSLLNGIKYKYWDNPDKFHHVIGLLHQLKLDTSTQVLEYQQILIKNRLSYLLRGSPELLGALLQTISDASNNTRHVLNVRPVSVGLQHTKGQQAAAPKVNLNRLATRPAQTFVLRNNTVPWQPWFAHLVPKASAAGRTVLRLQPGRIPYSFIVPKSPITGGSVQRIVTSSGLLTVKPTRPSTTTSMMINGASKQAAEFGVSRNLYEQVPSSLQSPKPSSTAQNGNGMKESSSDNNKQALLKKQQDFLRQLALLKTEKGTQGCSKQLFPSQESSSVSMVTGKQTLPTNAGDNTKAITSTRRTTMLTRSGNATIRMATRQSPTSSVKTQVKKNSVRKSPRNKIQGNSDKTSTDSQDNGNTGVGKEKGLLLSRVGEHCIVVSIPNQSSGSSSASRSSGNKTENKSSAANSENKKKHKKKKKHSKSRSEDAGSINSPTIDKAFERVKKRHKKRHKAWMKAQAQAKEKDKLAEHELHHREISSDVLKGDQDQIKISSNLFKTKRSLNRNNSCSSSDTQNMKTPRKRNLADQEQTPDISTDSANLNSLISPSCFVSLKKMKLDRDVDVESYHESQVQYEVDGGYSSSFPYTQELSVSNRPFDQGDLMSSQRSVSYPPTYMTHHMASTDSESSVGYGSNACSQDDTDTHIDICSIDDTSASSSSLTGINTRMCNLPSSVNHQSAGTSDMNVYSTHSFLGRLLISPSPPKQIQHKHTRMRRPRSEASRTKVRKSKRQKRKRRQKERKEKAGRKEERHSRTK